METLFRFRCNASWRMRVMFISTLTVIIAQICKICCDSVYKKGHLYTLSAVDVLGKTVPLSNFRGKALLIVNVATYCGFTQSHYKDLVNAQTKFGSSKFAVLAFPCNQFGDQEPDTNEEIIEFLKQVYKVNFPVFQKIEVVGENAHPLFQYLADQTGKAPTWNFWKYLVDHKGNVLNVWPPTTSVESLTSEIQKVVDQIPSVADEL